MFKSIKYVLHENVTNLFRIYSIAKYELLADMRDSKLGLFWNFAHPLIQVLTYWFAFGIVFNRKAVTSYGVTIPYIFWMMGGMVVWFFISPCITNGCNAVFSKVNVITKMKFPVSILPATVVLKELFNHFCLLVILFCIFLIGGIYPNIHWFGIFYYMLCAIIFAISLSMTTSVLNMLARDTRKLVLACMRLLLYLTPILWDIKQLKHMPAVVGYIMKANPIYYVVQGYRDCFFYHKGILFYHNSMIAFWIITIILFVFGSCMMYKFKHKFIDLI
ncbi:MAG: ABC transporter permease [Longibaculum muris]|uniref:Transport permease protein n=1 Tax=Longibaculum muris TaxID=1796628 RepID=A0A4R3ZAW2_9FIRM|nr:ABC transporter permease [Longibaculum muris]KXU46382.1 ABC-2 type transporter [Candidatus Stoquefichus sp. KLE1796]MBS5369272.1 ABC transporter permease [Coprobacillus cateniformis]MCR1886466.1 ABC transporter permease [Longibaculum muris]MED9811038.1 ABC transporter permease [Longibaculum muris]TCW02737.1 teichoic acid transport system permease protein [Longibaculum muris]